MIGFDSLIDSLNIKEFSDTLRQYLDNDQKEIYSLDRIENNIGVLENRDTGEIIEVPKEELSEDLKDGDIFEFFDGVFEKNDNIYDDILNNIDNLRENISYKQH